MIFCPCCGGKTIVVNSREDKGNTVRRRRECVDCGARFSTIEAQVIKNKGEKQNGK